MPKAAQSAALMPLRLRVVISAPASSNNCTMRRSPEYAAIISGVVPSGDGALTSACLPSSMRAVSSRPFEAA
ncbi:Uncharacterised protein [Bordetella pertussis]|nr:Uncharacterised protein [Bordetella pertussis]